MTCEVEMNSRVEAALRAVLAAAPTGDPEGDEAVAVVGRWLDGCRPGEATPRTWAVHMTQDVQFWDVVEVLAGSEAEAVERARQAFQQRRKQATDDDIVVVSAELHY